MTSRGTRSDAGTAPASAWKRSRVGRSAMLRPSIVQAVEEKCPDRQLGAQRLDIELAAEAAHGDLKGMRPLRGIECDRLAVEHQRMARRRYAPPRRFPARHRSPRSTRGCRCAPRRPPCAPGCARRPSSIRTPLRLRALSTPRPHRQPSARASAKRAGTARAGIAPRCSAPFEQCDPRHRSQALRVHRRAAHLPRPAQSPAAAIASSMTPASAPWRSSPTTSRSQKFLFHGRRPRKQAPPALARVGPPSRSRESRRSARANDRPRRWTAPAGRPPPSPPRPSSAL